MPNTLVIGATGTVGRHVVARLVTAGRQVRAMGRRPDPVSFPPGVEAVPGDLTRPETLDRALSGIDSVFLIWTAPPATVQPALERIAKHARRIVFLSAPLKTSHPFFQQPNPNRDLATRIEAFIEQSGLEWTFLRPHMFAANALRFWGPQIRAGNTVRWPYLDVHTAPIDERDIADAAVRTLTEDTHIGSEYVLTGPESLSQYEQIAILGRAVGRSLDIQEISPDEARRQWTEMPPAVVEMLLAAWAAAIGRPAYVTTTFHDITGAPPRSFLDWAIDHAPAFRPY